MSGGSPESRQYDVALSYAGEDREYVEAVAAHLREHDVRVFYDGYEPASLWGKDLYEHLSEVYEHSARFCVMFISEHYAEKVWPNHERKSAQSRALAASQEYVLPARFDDTSVPGVLPTVAWQDLRTQTPEQFGDLIIRKLDLPARPDRSPRSRPPPAERPLSGGLSARDEPEPVPSPAIAVARVPTGLLTRVTRRRFVVITVLVGVALTTVSALDDGGLVEHVLPGQTIAAATVDGRSVVLAAASVPRSETDAVSTWDLWTGERIGGPLTNDIGGIYCAAAAHGDQGPIVVTGGSDRSVRTWNVATGAQVGDPITVHPSYVRAVATARIDGRPVVISGGSDSAVRMRGVPGGEPAGPVIDTGAAAVYALATADLDGRTAILTGDSGGFIRFWGTDGEVARQPLHAHDGRVLALATARIGGAGHRRVGRE
ncbi:TIR domain-containing protein [Pseudonocardia humida]|uniref:TIR domain-containing protein n=1 Tax=Pseudonocardia humida TaxID=2800819 RepID=A0ABT0ZXP0_9PSEU|nr:TIR domain-containing protein [Pseudonocardia humida]MCO1655510.1 TIR domain-containing protein [Pseudonocardia humida]